jgi:aspartate/methionine/tyrosine aminotransferase
MAPGLDFDTRRGNRTVRMSFAGATDDIERALTALAPVVR